jgi:hypothetical protein
MKRFSLLAVLTLLSLVVCSQALAAYDVYTRYRLSNGPDIGPGTPRSEEFISLGEPNQRFELSSLSVIPGTVRVQVLGDYWEEVIRFADSLPDSPHFVVLTEESGATSIVFGDGVTGAIPPVGGTIKANYRELVPEPSSLLALSGGLLGLAGFACRRHR